MFLSDLPQNCGHSWRHCCLCMYIDISWMCYWFQSSCVLIHTNVHVHCSRDLCGRHLFLAQSMYDEKKYLLPTLQSDFFWSSSLSIFCTSKLINYEICQGIGNEFMSIWGEGGKKPVRENIRIIESRKKQITLQGNCVIGNPSADIIWFSNCFKSYVGLFY